MKCNINNVLNFLSEIPTFIRQTFQDKTLAVNKYGDIKRESCAKARPEISLFLDLVLQQLRTPKERTKSYFQLLGPRIDCHLICYFFLKQHMDVAGGSIWSYRITVHQSSSRY